MDEDDLYGGDLYGPSSLGLPSADGYGGASEGHAGEVGHDGLARPVSIQHAHGRSSSEQQEELKKMQGKYMESLQMAERWRSAFKQVATICGYSLPAGKEPDVPAVLESVQRMRTAEQTLQTEVKTLRRREAGLQIQLAERQLEGIEMRRELAQSVSLSDPSILQLKQLMLDPAVAKEFKRLQSELEVAQEALKASQQELTALAFTQESKIGRQLMQKCRNLQSENEEMGLELSEGKLHALGVQLGLAKEYADAMRRSYVELQEHCGLLDDEVEELQRELFTLRRTVREVESQHINAFMGGGGGGPGDFNGGPGPGPGMGGGMLPPGAFRRPMDGFPGGPPFRGRGGRGMGPPGGPMGPPGMGGPMMDRKRGPPDGRDFGLPGAGRGGPGGPPFRPFRGN